VPESVHAQAAANDECVAFSVVFPGSRLPFTASVRRFATVFVVEFENFRQTRLTVWGGPESGTRFRNEMSEREDGSWYRNRHVGARVLVKENGAESVVR